MRDRHRSLFPVLMVAAGAFLTVFLHGFMQGVMGDVVSSNARFDTGHVKVTTRAYAELMDQSPNDLAILGVDDFTKRLREYEPEMIWTPRIRFGGLLDIPDESGETRVQSPVAGIAVNMFDKSAPDKGILNLENALVEGHIPEKANEILLSHDFARRLSLSVGDRATLIGSTMHGAMVVHNFRVSGMVRFGIAAMDRSMVIADISDVQFALDMQDAASEVLGFTPLMMYEDKNMRGFSQKFNREFSKENDEFSPFIMALGEQHGLGEYIQLGVTFGTLIVLIFVIAMAIVLWNAGLMNGLRRYGEIGVRLAMGEAKGLLYRRMIFEAIIVGFAGSVLGTLIGVGISYYIELNGIDFGSFMRQADMLISSVIRTRVTPTSFYIGFIPGLVASVLGTMFSGVGIYRRQTSQLFKELEV
ncbi:MAG: FtsX-like permease family protein [bacterium]